MEPANVVHPSTYFVNLTKDDIMKMTFESHLEAFKFYNDYANVKGFSVRKDSIRRDNHKTRVLSRLFVCSCQGTRPKKYIEMEDRQRDHRALTRCNCKAKLFVRLDIKRQRYVVITFTEEHSHDLVPMYGVSHLSSHRHVDDRHRYEAHIMRSAGIGPNRVMDYYTLVSGGYQNVGFLRRDLYNMFQRDGEQQTNEGDINCALAYLTCKIEHDPMFVFKYTVNDENRLDKLFWTDGRSRAEYGVFGDVLIFDATYKTNTYKFPLVILAGVNNHRNTCIFGAALIEKETIDYYIWVLTTFVTVMDNMKPLSVITDGDRSMQAAINRVFPDARHRLCNWHLQRNASTNVKIPDFGDVFIRYMSLKCSPEEFDIKWNDMVKTYNLENNNWIAEIYEKRHMWSEAYLCGHFFAFAKSTQRCEGMNAQIKENIRREKRLYYFMQDYHKGLLRVRTGVVDQEVKTNYTRPVLTTSLKDLEEHASQVYTRNIFMDIKKQIDLSLSLWHSSITPRSSTFREYVIEDVNNEKLSCHVLFESRGPHVKCNCKRFESYWVVCKHIIYVLKVERVKKIPPSCVRPRWTADISTDFRDKGLSIFTTNESDKAKGYLLSKCNEMVFYAIKTAQGYKECANVVDDQTKRMKELWMMQDASSSRKPGLVQQTYLGVSDPKIAKPKGTRDKSGPKERAPRRCGKCRLVGHQANKCPKERADRSDDTTGLPTSWTDLGSQSRKTDQPMQNPGHGNFYEYHFF